jgi:hypothetical protein
MENRDEKIVLEFTQSIDFYWRSIAVYSVILIFYSIAFGSISEGTFVMSATNPVVMLLMLIIIGTTFSLLYRLSRKRAIILSNEYIIFKSRFGEKKYFVKDIKQIIFARERIFRTRRKFSVIKFKVGQRKLAIRIRPSSFDNDDVMIKMIQRLAHKVNIK